MSRLIRSLPNVFTLANLISGVIALVFIVNKIIAIACFLIFLSAIFDFLDGKVARKLKATSEFGVTLDSLSDLVSFGVVPALALYEAFPQTGFIQTILTQIVLVVFPATGCLRLARFNTKPTIGFFEGLPITAAGVIVAILLLTLHSSILVSLIAILLSFLMISKIKVSKL